MNPHQTKPNWKFERKVSDPKETTIAVYQTDTVYDNRGALKGVHKIVTYINVPTLLFDSLLCARYSHTHRMITGVIVMCLGVAVAKIAGHHPNLWLAGAGDLLGYAIHGMGLTPFAVYLAEHFEKKG